MAEICEEKAKMAVVAIGEELGQLNWVIGSGNDEAEEGILTSPTLY